MKPAQRAAIGTLLGFVAVDLQRRKLKQTPPVWLSNADAIIGAQTRIDAYYGRETDVRKGPEDACQP